MIFLPYGLDVWDPGYLDFWYDADFLISMAVTLGFFVLPGLWVTVFYPGDLYVLTREGILHACRKGEEEFRWIEITDIQRYSGEGGSGILLKAGRRTLDMPDRLSDPSAFYAQALKSLPVSLHDTEGYRWMGSRTRGPNGDRRKEGKEPMRDSGRP